MMMMMMIRLKAVRWKREEVIKSSEKETLWIERRPTWQLANEHDGDDHDDDDVDADDNHDECDNDFDDADNNDDEDGDGDNH